MKDSKKNYLKKAMLLYAVTDRSWVEDGDSLYNQCEKAIKGGITLLQLREKHLSDDDFVKEGLEIKELCHKNNIKLIINDNLEVMKRVDADGIHIGQEDGNIRAIREAIGPDKILGVSVQTVQETISAVYDGADYLGIGAIFRTSTKLDAVEVTPETLNEITKISPIPTCGIGGVGVNNIVALTKSGLNGVAIVSAIFGSDDIVKSTKELKEKCTQAFYKNNRPVHIYDLDGTLIDSLGVWKNLASTYIKDKGLMPHKGLDETVLELSLEESSEFLKKEYGLKESLETIRLEITDKIYDLYAHSIKLKSGTKEFIEEMYNNGTILTVATASTEKLCKAVLKNNNLYKYFTIVKSESQIGSSKARDTKICDEIIKELDVKKEDVLVFEDSAFAIKTLKKNGYFTVGVYDGNNKESIQDLCDYYIEDFREE